MYSQKYNSRITKKSKRQTRKTTKTTKKSNDKL